MDGWETRRRRDLGPDAHDWCIVRLGARGIVRGVDVDTAFFTGNYPGVVRDRRLRPAGRCRRSRRSMQAPWREICCRARRSPATRTTCSRSTDAPPATHLRLRIFPDGGVARLRVYGEVVADWDRLRASAATSISPPRARRDRRGRCSDMFYGSRHNLIMPGDATHMGDGWETKRRRGPGHDWTIVRLGAAGTIRRVEVDTRHFKGNAPGACSLDAVRLDAGQSLEARRGASCCRARRCSRTPGTRSRTSCAASATSRTCGSIFFPTAASRGCGCSGGHDDEGVAEIAETR